MYIEPGGQLTMNGGSIVGCVASGSGGGVLTQANAENELHGAFIMNGGAIDSCRCVWAIREYPPSTEE